MGAVPLQTVPRRSARGAKPGRLRGRRGVVGDGMVRRFDVMKQGDLPDFKDGVHVPDSGRSGTARYEEPVGQESEHP